MPEIALRTYIEQLDTLIERKQIDEVVAHCRHLLSFYPKHLDTYRMLGKALLEKGRHGDAADIFQRVLSVVPDDFIAHVGMSIVREDEANLDAAIWHMERAFEAAPANGAIQQELCRLYGRRDGVVPAKARLTRGALARMYAQGGLFLQAEAELRAALADEPDRIDLQTVMARVYAQSDQPAQAAQTCAGILQKLPYSLEANRILYGIFRAQGRPDDATAYRKRVEALDPYEALVDPNGGNARRVEANKIVLDRLEYAPGMEDSGSPDWLASIGAKFEEPSTRPADAQPAWMTAPEPVTPAEADAAENAPAPTGGSELPDWLRDLQPSAPAAAPEPTAAPDWLRDLGVTSAPLPSAPAANADLPDWLQTATGPMADSAVPEWMRPALETPPAGSTDDTLIGTPPAAAATDETLVGTPANTAATKPFGAPAAPEPEGDDIPAWLVGAAVAAKVVLPTGEAAPPAETGDDDLPEWLRSMSPATLEAAGAPEPTPAAAAGELPDWMQSAQETATETPTPVAVGEAGDLPDWMKGAAEPAAEMPAAEAPAPAATPPEDELPDWMQGLAAEAAVEASPPASDQMDTLVPGQTEAMTPVADSEATLVSPAAAVRLGEDEVPEWLRPGAAPESSAPEPDWLDALKEAGTAETPTLAAAEIPDWLKPAAPVDAAPADDVPAWLEAAGSAAAADEVPAWMRAPEPNAAAAPAEASAPAEAETPARPMDDVPDWLRPAVPGEAVAAMPVAEVPPAAVERPADEDGVPDWLRALPAADATPPAPQQVPDWLKGIAVEAPAPDPLGAKAAVDLPDFLQPASPEAIARAERPFELQGEDDRAAEPEPDEPALVMPAEIPDWLKGLAPVEADPVASIGAVAAATTAAAAETLAEPEPAAASDDTLNWLASLTAQPPQAGEPLADLPPDVPPWAEPATPGPSDTIANWLAGRSSNEATPAAPAPAMEAPSLAEESAQETPAGELPPWAETEAPGPTDTIIGWLTAKDVLAAQPTAPETPAEPPVAETPAAPLEPSAAADLDGDEALRWLESLATRQGANPDELLTAPEDRSSEPPAWMAAEAAAPGPLAEAAEPEAEAEPAELPDWLKALEPAAGVEPPMAAELPVSEPVMAETTAAVEPAAEAEATPLDGDEALRWLEDLAARQGANPEELLTTPEERLSEAPAWAAAEVAAGEAVAETSPAVDSPAAEAPAEPPVEAVATPAAELPPAEMPDWLKALEPAAGLEAFESLAAEPEDSLKPTPADELPDWLKALEPAAGVAAIPPAEVEPAIPPDMPADEIPDWLRPEPPAALPVVSEPEAETPAWLAEALSGTGALATAAAASVEPEPEPAAEPPTEYPAASASPEAPVAEPAALETWLSQVEAAHPVDPFADTAPHRAGAAALSEPAAEAETHRPEAALAEGAAETEPLDGDEALRWLEGLAAAQGANPDELLTAPEERPAETPAWIVAEQAAAPVEAAEEAVAQPTPLDEMPAWLREAMPAEAVTVEPEVELPPPSLAELAAPAPADVDDTGPSRVTSWPAAEPEAVAGETTAEAAAEPAELDGDEALRWLEGLAAAQGANPEELLTKPDERPAETPAWIVAEQTELTSAEAALTGEPGDLQTEPTAGEPTRPDWLPAEPREPVHALAAEDSAAELPAEAAAEGTELDGDEALRWLEGLAAAQGANADELLTKPEDRLSEAPAWAAVEATGVDTAATELAASAEAEAALEPEPMVEPEPVEAITPPTWVAGEVAADAGEAAAPELAAEATDETPAEHTPATGTADLSKLSRLSERLANARRARETEIEARFAEQRAQQEAARREVEQRMAAWRDAMEADEAAPESTEPPTPAPTPEPEPVAVPVTVPVAVPASAPYVRPHTPPAAAPRVPAELPDFAAALARLTPQVQAGADLAHTIHELEGLATAEQAPAPVLRLLGDAYVRADRLPRALEAYREALSRL